MATGDPIWCAHPRLRPNEAFSAWLHRCATANGVADHTFMRHILPQQEVWTRDADRLANDEWCALAGAALGVPVDRLRAATLARYEGSLYSTITRSGWLPWITPVGIFHRRRRHHGWAFCSACLAEQRTAQLRWRVAFLTICPTHACWLHDRCARCDAPFEFHRMGLDAERRMPCATCGHDLGATGTPRPLTARTLSAQQRLSGIIRWDGITLGNTHVSAYEAFAGIRRLLPALWPASGTAGLIDAWTTRERRHVHVTAARPPGPFERWPLPDRSRAMRALAPYLDDWPDRFIHDARRAGMRGSRLDAADVRIAPAWLRDAWQKLRP